VVGRDAAWFTAFRSRVDRRLHHVFGAHLDDRGALEHVFSREQEISHGAERVEIRAPVDRVRLRDRLGRHIEGRAGNGIAGGRFAGARSEPLHETEVDHLHDIGLVWSFEQDDIGGGFELEPE
jgi:hypothetical protein